MKKRRKLKKAQKRRRGECYIAFEFWEIESPAFLALSADAVRVYFDLRKRLSFDASNNGSVVFSHREAAAVLHAGWRRGSNALAELTDYGFIKCREPGEPGAAIRLASEWQLTAFPCGGQEAAKTFMRWDGELFEPAHKGKLGNATVAKRASEKQRPIGNMKTPRRQHEDAYPRLVASNDPKTR